MKCSNCEGNCGLNNVTDGRCCFYCNFKGCCRGFCVILETEGDYEEIANKCIYFTED